MEVIRWRVNARVSTSGCIDHVLCVTAHAGNQKEHQVLQLLSEWVLRPGMWRPEGKRGKVYENTMKTVR